MQPQDCKQFIIDYTIGFKHPKLKCYMTVANSRKDAEIKTRNMEHPDKINITRITKIDLDEATDKLLMSIIHQHSLNNHAKDDKDQYSNIDEQLDD